ncbi:hypothetical protein KXS11_00240 [Plantibacter flavus]|uniref:hypothetical protein n=1 Tax=Plantibacter flavus TaxID=150123 RepID=UPI003F13582F
MTLSTPHPTQDRSRRRFAATFVATLALSTLVLSVLQAPPAHAAVQQTIYVTPTGSDSAAGTLAAPLQTLDGARARVASVNSSMTGDIVVQFRGGSYPVSSAVTFGIADSGTNGYTVSYQAYPGETPVFNGGDAVTGWTLQSGNIWVADLARTTKLRTLYVNGERAVLARSTGVQAAIGGSGSYTVAATDPWALDGGSTFAGITLSGSGLPASLSQQSDMEIVNQDGFSFHVVGLTSVTTSGSNRVATLQQPMGAIALTTPQPWGSAFFDSVKLSANNFYLQNAIELLDQPGEFYFDRTAGKLYYSKPATVDLSTASVVAPRAEKLMTIAGTSTSARVHDIAFSGFTVANMHWSLLDVGSSVGASTVQSNALYSKYWSTGNWHTAVGPSGTSGYANTTVMPAAVEVQNAQRIAFAANTFTRLGAGALNLGNDTVDSVVSGSRFIDISGSAITVGSPYNTYIGDGDLPTGVEGAPTNDTITNNVVDRAGAEFLQTVPLAIYYAQGLSVTHNEISNAPYTGISMGWGFNDYYQHKPAGSKSTVAGNNTVDYNIVSKTMTKMHDGGAIYTLGAQPGSSISHNLIEHTGGASQGNPLYTDQSSSGLTIAANVIDDFNGTWWWVWGANAFVSGLTIADNVVNSSGVSETKLLQAGGSALTTTVTGNRVGWTSTAQATSTDAGLQAPYQSLVVAANGQRTRNTVEAESGTFGGRARVATDTAASGGKVVERLDKVGDSVSFPDVAQSDTVTVKYAAATSGTIGVYVGSTRVASLAFSSTGAWYGTYNTVSVPAAIPAGSTVTIKNATGDAGLNADQVTFTRVAAEFVEPESAGTFVGRALACATGITTFNQGAVCQLDVVGDAVSVTSATTRTALSIRYAAPVAGGISVYVNGTDVGTLTFTATGGWYTGWNRASLTTAIPAGAVVTFRNDAGDTGLNIDSVRFD